MIKRWHRLLAPNIYTGEPPDTTVAITASGLPSPAYGLNVSHPSVDQLIMLVPCNYKSGTKVRELVSEKDIDCVNTPVWNSTGIGLDCDATNNRYPGIFQKSFSMSEMTFLSVIKWVNGQPNLAGSGAYQAILEAKDSVNTKKYGMWHAGSTEAPALYDNTTVTGGVTLEAASTAINRIKRRVAVTFGVVSKKGNFAKLYGNGGVQIASTTGYSATNTATQIEMCNSSYYGTNRTPNCTAYLFAVWQRALSQDEIWEISRDPFSLLAPPRTLFHGIVVVSNALTVNVSDTMGTLVDSFDYVGGDPDFQIQQGDQMAQSDSLALGYGLSFTDDLNNLADALSENHGGIGINAYDSMMYDWADALVTKFIGDYQIQQAEDLNNLADALATVLATTLLTVSVADSMNNWADAVSRVLGLTISVEDINKMADSLFSDGYRLGHLLTFSESMLNLSDLLAVNLETAAGAFADSMNNLNDAVAVQLNTQLTVTAADQMNTMSDAVAKSISNAYTDTSFLNRLRRYLNDV